MAKNLNNYKITRYFRWPNCKRRRSVRGNAGIKAGICNNVVIVDNIASAMYLVVQ